MHRAIRKCEVTFISRGLQDVKVLVKPGRMYGKQIVVLSQNTAVGTRPSADPTGTLQLRCLSGSEVEGAVTPAK